MAYGGLLLIVITTLCYAFCRFIRILRKKRTIGFFHPYCDAGGGGERVLWCAINAMTRYDRPPIRFVVYTGDRQEAGAILAKAKERFNIEVSSSNIQFVYLRSRPLLEASLYPRFTLLLQMLAGFIVGLEALIKCNPEVFIDTMGYPLTLPLFRLIGGAKVGCYVHYPTISTDMIERVLTRETAFNNAKWIAKSHFLTFIKLIYYRLFAFIYRLCGMANEVVMVNGSWTKDHIVRLWKIPKRTHIVYPPCNVDYFMKRELKAESLLHKRNFVQILSVGQIRPEKNHKLQIQVFAKLKDWTKSFKKDFKFHFVICGGCRNEKDIARLEGLKRYAKSLDLTDEDIEWAINASVESLSALLENSLIGIHTMYNEHFGISVVEGLAAGHMMIANNSGGPKMDIINNNEKQIVGFLAATVDEYVDCVIKILQLSPGERESIRIAARSYVIRFSEKKFEASWNAVTENLIS